MKFLSEPPNSIRIAAEDYSAWALLATNVVVIVMALAQDWNVANLMVVYWCQSAIIGIFTVAKILSLKSVSDSEDLRKTGAQVKNPVVVKIFNAVFFAIHYGGFHLGYLVFIAFFLGSGIATIPPKQLLLTIMLLFANHLFSFIYNFKGGRERRQNISRVFFFPYARILPMHLAIMLGLALGGSAPLLIFLVMKTLADIAMHNMEHAWK